MYVQRTGITNSHLDLLLSVTARFSILYCTWPSLPSHVRQRGVLSVRDMMAKSGRAPDVNMFANDRREVITCYHLNFVKAYL